MRIAAPFAGILRGQIEMAERHFSAGGCVVEIDGLFPLFVGIGVVENPLVAGQVCAMAVFGHNIFADYFDPSAAPSTPHLGHKLRANG